MRKELRLQNELHELNRIKEGITQVLQPYGSQPNAEFEMNLIAEELFTNAIHHGFPDQGAHEIRMELSTDTDGWEIVMEDDGIAFDPTQAPEANINASLQEREVGGLGIHLIRKTADVFEYKHQGSKNVVRVRKKINLD